MIRNIVFDFGNVIGRYNSEELIGRFCQAQADRQAFRQAIFYDWASLDAGRISYEVYTAQALERLPSRLHTAARAFFRDWYRYLPYMDGIPELIADLKAQNVPRYLLSNASVFLHSIWIFMTLYRALTELSFQAKCKWQNRSRGFTPIC